MGLLVEEFRRSLNELEDEDEGFDSVLIWFRVNSALSFCLSSLFDRTILNFTLFESSSSILGFMFLLGKTQTSGTRLTLVLPVRTDEGEDSLLGLGWVHE